MNGESSSVQKIRDFLPILLASFLLFAFISPVSAAERILSMEVTGTVEPDAHFTVTEKILVQVENIEIKRGIIRVFPTDYTDTAGRRNTTDFNFISAEIDGKPAPVSVSRSGGRAEMRIGDPNVILSKKPHEITLTYRTLGWIAFRDSSDELYWNVTGDEWEFPIARASFKLILPEGGFVSQTAAYTGKLGSKGTDWEIAAGDIISSTRELRPGEGLTVVYAWNKGVVTEPFVPWHRRVREPIFAVGIALAVFLYYFAAWYLVGRDPAAKRIIPLYKPPKDIEPGFARYLKKLDFSNECLAADIMQLAVLGFARFADGESKTANLVIEAAEKTRDDNALASLPDSLRQLAAALFPKGGINAITVSEVDGKRFSDAADLLKKNYKSRGREYFRKNTAFSLLGLIFFLPFIMLVPSVLIRILLFLPARGWFLGVIMFISQIGRKFGKIKILLKIFGAALVLSFAGSVALAFQNHKALLSGLAVAVAVAVIFSRIMSAYTEKGARVAEEIKGLEMYMNTAERYRLAMIYKPEETPLLFESLLPYAFALGCAETWADSFANVLAKASYVPEWDCTDGFSRGWAYSGDRYNGLSRGITSSISNYHAAQARTSSSYSGSSGFGGGGHSGGGGGGGGGRGW